MNVTQEQIGTPIIAADVTLAILKKDKRGILLGFYVNPQDISPEMLAKDYGDVMRLFITDPAMGA